jgi:rare lipoprotein A
MRHLIIACAVAFGARCDAAAAEQGVASFYGPPGGALTAAHRSLPKGSEVRVRNLDNGRSADVKIVDRGPFVRGRVIDVSPAAADKLGFRGAGLAHVQVEPVAPGTPDVAAPVAYSLCEDDADRLQHVQGDPESGLQCATLRSGPFGLMAGSSYPALVNRVDLASLEGSASAAVAERDGSLQRHAGGPPAFRSPEQPPAGRPVLSFFARLRRLF